MAVADDVYLWHYSTLGMELICAIPERFDIIVHGATGIKRTYNEEPREVCEHRVLR